MLLLLLLLLLQVKVYFMTNRHMSTDYRPTNGVPKPEILWQIIKLQITYYKQARLNWCTLLGTNMALS